MKTIGSIRVTIRIRLDQDVTPEVARKFVDELDYTVKDTTGKVSIQEAELVEDDIDDNDNDNEEDN